MANKTIRFISTKMKDLDICMMSTLGRGTINTRPMSNNKDVKYNGESFFFSHIDTKKAKNIQRNPSVTLSFTGSNGLFIIVNGKARIIKTKSILDEHWVKSLETWFNKGSNTPGIILIAVKAEKIMYWNNYKEGTIDLV
jgi:general stress protein 26